jgi:hypothetical protein
MNRRFPQKKKFIELKKSGKKLSNLYKIFPNLINNKYNLF